MSMTSPNLTIASLAKSIGAVIAHGAISVVFLLAVIYYVRPTSMVGFAVTLGLGLGVANAAVSWLVASRGGDDGGR